MQTSNQRPPKNQNIPTQVGPKPHDSRLEYPEAKGVFRVSAPFRITLRPMDASRSFNSSDTGIKASAPFEVITKSGILLESPKESNHA